MGKLEGGQRNAMQRVTVDIKIISWKKQFYFENKMHKINIVDKPAVLVKESKKKNKC